MNNVEKRRKCKKRGMFVYLFGITLILSSNVFTYLGGAFIVHFYAFLITGFIVVFPVRWIVERKCRGGDYEESSEDRPLEIDGGKTENVEIY